MHFSRLDKWISSQSRLSRRQVKVLIRAGGVFVDGVLASSPEQKVAEGARVQIGGLEIVLSKHIYIMMNKPSGFISATADVRERTVMELVPENLWRPGLFPAGRLDKDTEGFLLLTNDGMFAHEVLSPVKHVPKTYFARLDREVTTEMVTDFARGIDLGGGDICSPAELTIPDLSAGHEAHVTIYEGMYHQVKRMFAEHGRTVLYLKRIRMGSLTLDASLPLGGCRPLSPDEKRMILRDI